MLDLSLFMTGGFDFVVVLNVQQNALRDLGPMLVMARTLRVLNASQNELSTLPDIGFWSQFRCLRLCFLSQNASRTWTDVQGLEACAGSLLWLTLANNPVMQLKNSREFCGEEAAVSQGPRQLRDYRPRGFSTCSSKYSLQCFVVPVKHRSSPYAA
ncbi:hypothetical protein DVH05_008701 [Phytophthora capsici]|nr:hypothetical protein DVH05_008701 [Phytophthora capsici]